MNAIPCGVRWGYLKLWRNSQIKTTLTIKLLILKTSSLAALFKPTDRWAGRQN